jgi:hypothetical protein
MFIFNKSKRIQLKKKIAERKAHRQALIPFRVDHSLNPIEAFNQNWMTSSLWRLFVTMLMSAFLASTALLLLSDPFVTMAKILQSAWNATGRTADFQTLLAGFGAAVILLNSVLISLLVWAFGSTLDPAEQTVLDMLVELDERTQNQIAELRMELQLKEGEQTK